jgi:hypothetical protein
MKTYGKTIFALVVGLTLLTQLAIPSPVYADDGTPPPPAESETEVAPPEEPAEPPVQPEEAATEAAPVESPAAAELAPEAAPAELPVATEAPAENLAPVDAPTVSADTAVVEEQTVSEIIQELPEQTDIVVLDEIGEVVPLATQEAAEIVTEGDPIWCPEGVAPNPDKNGCTTAQDSFADLLPLISGKSVAGKIWIKDDYVGTSGLEGASVTIDGSKLGTTANYALTLQGGWNGASDGTITSTNSVFSVPITISNWNAAVIVNNITVNGVSNATGLVITTTNNASVNDSDFSGNPNSTGLYVRSNSNTILKNITASNNNMGSYIDNRFGTGVTMSGKNLFNYNGWVGLGVDSSGNNITLENVTANFNGWDGIYIYNTYGTDDGVIRVTGENEFGHNGGAGIEVASNGDINLENVTANYNTVSGGWIQNHSGTGDVVLTGKNQFIENTGSGLVIASSGNIELTGVTAEDNSENGVLLFTPGNAAINNSSSSNSNPQFFGVDASAVCGNLTFDGFSGTYDPPIEGTYSYSDLFNGSVVTIYCKPKVYINGVLVGGGTTTTGTLEISGSLIEFDLSCAVRDNFFATLPNGDRIQIFCPVSGKASIKRLDNTMLPADLPAGYTYASAFSLDIFQGLTSIPVITEGGTVRAMFKLPSLEPGTNYSILYWDNGNKKWIPLKEFMSDENDQPRGFPLYTDDPRVILSGLKFVTTGDYPHVEVSTNFPGIFVLAQR